MSFDDAGKTRIDVRWHGRQVSFLGLEELLRNKRAAGRSKDLLDAETLEKLHRGT